MNGRFLFVEQIQMATNLCDDLEFASLAGRTGNRTRAPLSERRRVTGLGVQSMANQAR